MGRCADPLSPSGDCCAAIPSAKGAWIQSRRLRSSHKIFPRTITIDTSGFNSLRSLNDRKFPLPEIRIQIFKRRAVAPPPAVAAETCARCSLLACWHRCFLRLSILRQAQGPDADASRTTQSQSSRRPSPRPAAQSQSAASQSAAGPRSSASKAHGGPIRHRGNLKPPPPSRTQLSHRLHQSRRPGEALDSEGQEVSRFIGQAAGHGAAADGGALRLPALALYLRPGS